MKKLPYKQVLDLSCCAYYSQSISQTVFEDLFIEIDDNRIAEIIHDYYDVQHNIDLYVYNDSSWYFDTSKDFYSLIEDEINIQLNNSIKEEIKIQCSLSNDIDNIECLSEIIKILDIDIEKNTNCIEIIEIIEETLENFVDTEIRLCELLDYPDYFDIDMGDFIKKHDIYTSRGYSQGDVVNVIIPQIDDDNREKSSNKIKLIHKNVDNFLWDAPWVCNIQLGNTEYIFDEIFDPYEYWEDSREKIINYILDDNKELSQNELNILKSELEYEIPQTLDYT